MAPAAAGNLLALTDDNLAEILIRLPDLKDLGRACVVCPAFRRVITDHSFLRRLRALHPPSLLGIVANVFYPAEPPHPNAAAAQDFAAVDFLCSFLPSQSQGRWHPRDLRDGRALFSAEAEDSSKKNNGRRAVIRDFAVCDPIHRRYLLLPAIPDDLVALVDQQKVVEFEPFLAPASDEDADGISFKVICLVQCTTRLLVFEFSPGSGQWRASEFQGWKSLTAETTNPNPGFLSELSTRYYVHRRFCWEMSMIQKLLILDVPTMEFSSMDIPPAHLMNQRVIVEAEEGRFGLFTFHIDMVMTQSSGLLSCYRLFYTALRNDGKGATEQDPSEIIVLPINYRYNIMGVAGGYLLVQGIPEDMYSVPVSERPALDCFSVNLKTLQLEWFCKTKYPILGARLYAGFPLNLTPPTI